MKQNEVSKGKQNPCKLYDTLTNKQNKTKTKTLLEPRVANISK